MGRSSEMLGRRFLFREERIMKCPDCGSESIGTNDECDPIRYFCMVCGLECDELNMLFVHSVRD
jgi:hypothetical protein